MRYRFAYVHELRSVAVAAICALTAASRRLGKPPNTAPAAPKTGRSQRRPGAIRICREHGRVTTASALR